jgi:hypothetical protein
MFVLVVARADAAKNWGLVGVGFALKFLHYLDFWIYIAESGHVSIFMLDMSWGKLFWEHFGIFCLIRFHSYDGAWGIFGGGAGIFLLEDERNCEGAMQKYS